MRTLPSLTPSPENRVKQKVRPPQPLDTPARTLPPSLATSPSARLVCAVRTRCPPIRGGSTMRAPLALRRPFAAALAATALFAPSARAAPWQLKPGEFYSEVGGEFFSARTFLGNTDGKRLTLNGTLEQRTARSHNEIGWKKRASVWLDMPFVSRTYASNVDGSRTSTGLGDFDFGLRIGMHMGGTPVALELGWSAPLGANRRLF